MGDLRIRVGDYAAETERRNKQRKRLFFWIVSGVLIALVAWFVTLPALLYDTDRPEGPRQERGLP